MKILKIPAAALGPRQLSLLFDSKQLTALNATDRSKVTLVLAQILIQAADLTVESSTMTGSDLLPASVLKRKAVVFVRQSTQSQVMTNLESQRRQYDLVEVARQRGFTDVEVIDADNLSAAWHAPGVTMRARQQLLRALIVDIVVDVDDQARDVVLTIHWRGGQHSELRVHKPRAGEHGCATTEDALSVMRSMAGRWSDEHIAASLNRMGIPTGQGKTWSAKRVGSVRRVRNIHAYSQPRRAANGSP